MLASGCVPVNAPAAIESPEEVVEVSWMRAMQNKRGGPIFAEARFRVNGGDWVKQQITKIENVDGQTIFWLTDRVGLKTSNDWIPGEPLQSFETSSI